MTPALNDRGGHDSCSVGRGCARCCSGRTRCRTWTARRRSSGTCATGPTAACSSNFNALIQYWTSRGFAILDVNYGGSTGYGRRYRQRLNGQWGVVDVDDCVNGALYLARTAHEVDEARLTIDGGSAGGFTTLFRRELSPWRYTSIPDSLVLARIALMTVGVFLLWVFILDRARGLPRRNI